MSPFYSDELLAFIDELGLVPTVLLTPTMLSVLDTELRARVDELRNSFSVYNGTPGTEGEVALTFLSLFVERYNRRGRRLDNLFYPQLTLEFSEV